MRCLFVSCPLDGHGALERRALYVTWKEICVMRKRDMKLLEKFHGFCKKRRVFCFVSLMNLGNAVL